MVGEDSELRSLKEELERTREQLVVERQRVEKYERRELDVLQGHRREVETLHRRIKDLEEDKRELKNQILQDANRIHDLSSALERTKETLSGREMLLILQEGEIHRLKLSFEETAAKRDADQSEITRLREEIARLHERENEGLKKSMEISEQLRSASHKENQFYSTAPGVAEDLQKWQDEYFSIMTNPKPLKELADVVGVDTGVGEYSSKDED
ncbi:hypothetical protein GUITHDRAFT_134556 [Guillardia theta CCMP2712]|uniref:Uncharacterized protein n=1 Tax=Guillardia theta (strain CCMP2712) TaxID=905079 RepID=L1JTM4_GUITC|nr:hypothetical protein GUITHDRAFT_134556 [Guillardia theta CCMP2712]EKX51669.1 hypothetical protein GUITHDRAFT_134556 [Guillardia theta CCMP2712]|eukprot:XP_005838649.1 hypothetical protein GUITHDRAFT_134556 [Guillardia theta CCMP2712]